MDAPLSQCQAQTAVTDMPQPLVDFRHVTGRKQECLLPVSSKVKTVTKMESEMLCWLKSLKVEVSSDDTGVL